MSAPTRKRDVDETCDLADLIRDVIDEPDQWLNSPNAQLGGEKPQALIGTDRERLLRELVRAIKIGMPT